MAVLAEAISIIVPVTTIRLRLADGLAGFRALVPNGTFACDGELARIGFMAAEDAVAFMPRLQRLGFCFVHNDEAVDFVFTNQQSGPTAPCPWLCFGAVTVEGNSIPAAWLTGSALRELHGPAGWQFAGSLSQTFMYVPGGRMAKSLKYLGHKDGVDLFHNRLTGETSIMARTRRQRLV